jgi:hypothetical protein
LKKKWTEGKSAEYQSNAGEKRKNTEKKEREKYYQRNGYISEVKWRKQKKDGCSKAERKGKRHRQARKKGKIQMQQKV